MYWGPSNELERLGVKREGESHLRGPPTDTFLTVKVPGPVRLRKNDKVLFLSHFGSTVSGATTPSFKDGGGRPTDDGDMSKDCDLVPSWVHEPRVVQEEGSVLSFTFCVRSTFSE